MNNITDVIPEHLPSTRTLLKATAIAIGVAALILTTIVLPAEYGIDPTGAGRLLGLTDMKTATVQPSSAVVPPAEPAAVAPGTALNDAGSPVWKSETPYRSDEMSLTLQPGEGAEIKARMKAGQRFVFNWVAEGGVVNFDMHGEPLQPANPDDYTSYWLGKEASSGNGAFEAPVEGTHGWYWRNRGEKPVTVRVQVSGFFSELYRPS